MVQGRQHYSTATHKPNNLRNGAGDSTAKRVPVHTGHGACAANKMCVVAPLQSNCCNRALQFSTATLGRCTVMYEMRGSQRSTSVVAERLRRQTRNLLGSPRVGSSPAHTVKSFCPPFHLLFSFCCAGTAPFAARSSAAARTLFRAPLTLAFVCVVAAAISAESRASTPWSGAAAWQAGK